MEPEISVNQKIANALARARVERAAHPERYGGHRSFRDLLRDEAYITPEALRHARAVARRQARTLETEIRYGRRYKG